MLHKTYKIRILIISMVLLLLFCVVEVRLYQLQIKKHAFLRKKADQIHLRRRVITPYRGEILDRHGNVLAVTTRLTSIYVHPDLIPENKKKELARRLSSVLLFPYEKIKQRLNKKGHFPLARKISDLKAAQVEEICDELELKRNALYFLEESKRLYPMGPNLAPVLGYTTIDDSGDNKGIFGLEMKYNEWLSGKYEKITTHRTALRQYLEPIEQDILESTYGHRLILTIDQNIQYIVERALRKGLAKWRADSAVCVILDVPTGEILAMCSLPSFDPDKFYSYDPDFRRNRCVSDPLEPGSVMKIFNSAILLDSGLVQMDEPIDCERGFAVIEGRRVSDAGGHKMGIVSFQETFFHSSNIAFCKLATRITPESYYSYLRAFGFGQKTGVDIPDESSGILYPVSRWSGFSRTSLGMGYEIGLTPVQIACALAALGNHGKGMRPFIVKEIQDSNGRTIQQFDSHMRFQVVSPQTAQKVLALMEGVVEQGTGKKARIPGYRIGGKTGTTRKSDKVKREYIAGFAALLPIDEPRIACYVAIDNPKEAYYASDVAVPVFHEIAQQLLSHLAIPPSMPKELIQTAELKPRTSPQSVPEKRNLKTVVQGKMPDLKGLSIKEVLLALRDCPLDLKMIGSGVVIDQTPQAATPLKDVKTCILIFGKSFATEL